MTKILSEGEKVFAATVKECRERLGFKQGAVAEHLSITQSVVAKWESQHEPVPLKHVAKLSTFLKIPQSLVDKYSAEKKQKESFVAASYTELRKIGMSDEEIFKPVDELLSEFPAAEIPSETLGSNDFGDHAKWKQFVQDFPESFRLITEKKSGTHMAFWHAMPISPDIYARGAAGKNINSELNREHLRELIIPSNYSLYFVDLFRSTAYRGNTAANRHILRSFLGFLYTLSQQDFYIDKILTHASSIEAEKICQELEFRFLCDHEDHRRYKEDGCNELVPTKVYELDMSKCSGKLLFSHVELFQKYHARFNFHSNS